MGQLSCGGRILVVDDDAACRAFVGGLLEDAGFATLEIATGREALAAARRERPALVLLEVCLPELSGFEVCRQLRDDFGDDLPIVFVSATRTEPFDRAAGLLVGADDYLVKPLSPDELLARVHRHIQRSRQSSATANGHDAGFGETAAPDTALFDLTPRELEVLTLLASGMDQREIAATLVISPKTVSAHIQRILGKLRVHSRAQAVAFAHQHGIAADFVAHAASPAPALERTVAA